MLKSALVAMTILGCNCEQNTCEYIRTADIAAADMSDCQARMKGEIARTDAEYPLVVAVCEKLPDGSAIEASAAEPALEPVFDTRPAERTMMVRVRDSYSAVVDMAGDGLDSAVEFATIPADWVKRQIATVQELRW